MFMPHWKFKIDRLLNCVWLITVWVGGLLALLPAELLEDRLASLSAEFLGRFSVME